MILATVDLTAWQWALGLTAACLFGFSKTGVGGVGIVGVTLMAIVFPGKESVGLVLPMLIFTDVFAVGYYHRHAVWKHLFKLMPAAAVGIAIGYVIVRRIDFPFEPVIGGIVLLMVAASVAMRLFPALATAIQGRTSVALATGVLAGITTQMANAAGPIMLIYLLAMGMPKMQFVGTAAWYFMILNWVKVPLFALQGQITWSSLIVSAGLFPGALLGVVAGIYALKRIPQKQFDLAIWILATLGALALIFKESISAWAR